MDERAGGVGSYSREMHGDLLRVWRGTLRVSRREKQSLGYGHARSRPVFSSVVVCVS